HRHRHRLGSARRRLHRHPAARHLHLCGRVREPRRASRTAYQGDRPGHLDRREHAQGHQRARARGVARHRAAQDPESRRRDLLGAAGSVTRGFRDWRNWSGSVACRAAFFAAPTTEDQVVDVVRAAARAGQPVRVAATGHSFVPLCATEGALLTLTGLVGVVSTDPAAGLATVWAGSTIQQLGPRLRAQGLAMVNMGDIDRQGIAGAVSTGTHGTGRGLGSISTQVAGLRLVDAEGEIGECNAARGPELLQCGRVALGTLGVLTQVRLRVLPAYRLHERKWEEPFDACMERLEGHIAATRHFEFFWRPRTDRCEMKPLHPTHAEPGAVAGRAAERIGWSDEILPTERTVKFNEMEFAVPEAAGPDCIREIRALLSTRHPH